MQDVIPNSPASRAGIYKNDILLSINGRKLTRNISLTALVASLELGSRVEVELLRCNKKLKLIVVMEARKSNIKTNLSNMSNSISTES